MGYKRANTASEVLNRYAEVQSITPDWERTTHFSWNDMILLKDEITKLKGLMLKAATDLEIEHGYHHRVAKTLREAAK